MPIGELRREHAVRVLPGSFVREAHFYARTLEAEVHPLMAFFMRMKREQLVSRYCHLHPRVIPTRLEEVLSYTPSCFRWAGGDLFCTTTAGGARRMVLIETNSCPSGNKSMPALPGQHPQAGYHTLMRESFLPLVQRTAPSEGALAVVYDKNHMEAAGYAAALADLTGEPVYLAPMPADASDPTARFEDGVLQVRDTNGKMQPIRAAFRYVTQRPWTRIPVTSRTTMQNPLIACLAGGRNKLVAAKAYDYFNADLAGSGLELRTPETIRDARKAEIPLLIERFGGQAVVKVPYDNAGQGVFTITNRGELDAFMARDERYERFIVQSLIGNSSWGSTTRAGRFYHVGTVPNERGEIFVADLRMSVCATPTGFMPLSAYARRAPQPLTPTLQVKDPSWGMLGTNLSRKQPDGSWLADTDRLLMMDTRDFNTLGLGIDDLIEAFVQTVLATIAIDRMAANLLNQKGELRRKLFASLDGDSALMGELLP